MSWLRLDDRFPRHEKVAALSDAAFRAHVEGMAYCAENLTDGCIPLRIAEQIAGAALPELLRKPKHGEPLWAKCDGEYEVHDYLDYNPTREKVLADRQREADRKAAQRAGSCPGGTAGGTDKRTAGRTVNVPVPVPNALDPDLNPQERKTSPLSSKIDGGLLSYFESKVGREAKTADLRSLAVLSKTYGADAIAWGIGTATEQGESPDNFALITTILQTEAKRVSS